MTFSFQTFLHDQVFIPNLLGQMSPEQQAKWVDKAKNYAIIGCYAQTELGHGSNVRGLETTATFIPETDQFDIHTPSLRATKVRIGSNMCVCECECDTLYVNLTLNMC